MKKSLMLLGVIFIATAASAFSPKSDEKIKIVKSEQKYYVWSGQSIIDSLEYISPLIPENTWVKIYLGGTYVYRSSNQGKLILSVSDKKFPVLRQKYIGESGRLANKKILVAPIVHQEKDKNVLLLIIIIAAIIIGALIGCVLSVFSYSFENYLVKSLILGACLMIPSLLFFNAAGSILIVLAAYLGLSLWFILLLIKDHQQNRVIQRVIREKSCV
jgi:hypothetical protein